MVKRNFQLWGLYARLDLMWLFKDFRNFAVCAAVDIIEDLASVAGVWLIAERFTGIGGLGKFQILFLLGYSMTVSGIINTFFNWNILHISRRIGRGQLDHVLMQPQPLWMTLLTEGFVPVSGSGVLITGLILIIYSLGKLQWIINPLGILILFVSIVFSTIINISYSFLWGSLAFYAPVAAEEVCTSVVELFSTIRNYPLGGIGKAGQLILLSVLPVGYCAWYPTVYLTSENLYSGLLLLTAATALYFIITLFIFRKGMHRYVSKGSHRYHDRGHRR